MFCMIRVKSMKYSSFHVVNTNGRDCEKFNISEDHIMIAAVLEHSEF